ncbi:MAG: hypothetical protein K6F45_04400 [Saccharofermentans sp.]|nr:hypothetical protein [Saccharofermentans sp.]
MRGIFWIVEDELKAFVFEEGAECGVAKSGKTFNHKLLWEHVRPAKCNRAFDYYPRGRVDYNGKGRPVVYMSPHVGDEYVAQIAKVFGLSEAPVVHIDGSEHYKCYLDR